MEYALPEPKVVNYLLTNPKNPDFFSPLVTQLKVGRGYAMISWLLQIIFRIIFGRNTPHGDEYEIVGEVQAPNGRMITIRTGWMLREDGSGMMSFVTAYPA